MKTILRKALNRPGIMVGVIFALVTAGALGIALGTQQAPPQAGSDPLVGRAAPQFTLPNLDGENVSLSSFWGRVVIVDFWATWCGPCRMEIPHFIELQNKYGPRNFTFLGVSVDQDGPSVVKAFAAKNGMNYPQLMASKKVVADYGNFDGIPTTFIIDKKGIIRNMFVGYQSKEIFESEIKKLLAE